jgi:hypothetical protein
MMAMGATLPLASLEYTVTELSSPLATTDEAVAVEVVGLAAGGAGAFWAGWSGLARTRVTGLGRVLAWATPQASPPLTNAAITPAAASALSHVHQYL